jgi:Prolyl oligopeptidase family
MALSRNLDHPYYLGRILWPKKMTAFTLSLLVGLLCSVPTIQVLAQNSSGQVIFQLSPDPEFSFQLQQTISLANGGGANTGEVLRAANQIVPGDFESYYNAFYTLGSKLHNYAESINISKYPISARDTYFRSSTYLRSSVFFLTGNKSDPRLYTVFDEATADFDKALSLMDIPGIRYNISAPKIRPNFTAPIIFFKAKKSNSKTPTVIFGSGYDEAQEDGLPAYGQYVLERGWNFVTYEGPGQNTPRRQQNIGFMPNWWDVVTPVVDYVVSRPDVDASRLALVGESFGGILAPRAATHEKRFVGVIAIDGAYNLRDVVLSEFSTQVKALYNSANKTAFDAVLNALRLNTTSPSSARWGVNQGLWSFDTDSPYEWLQIAGNINITQESIKNITSKVFIGSGQNDTSFPGQAPIVAEWFGDKAYFYNFTDDVGAGQHCQIGAEGYLASVSLDWLTDIFANATEH